MDHLMRATLDFWLTQSDVAGAALDAENHTVTVSFTNGEEFMVRFEETSTVQPDEEGSA